MMDSKPWYLSKGFVGPLIAVIAISVENLGIMSLDADAFSEVVFQFIALAGAALGMFGRATADKRLTKL